MHWNPQIPWRQILKSQKYEKVFPPSGVRKAAQPPLTTHPSLPFSTHIQHQSSSPSHHPPHISISHLHPPFTAIHLHSPFSIHHWYPFPPLILAAWVKVISSEKGRGSQGCVQEAGSSPNTGWYRHLSPLLGDVLCFRLCKDSLWLHYQQRRESVPCCNSQCLALQRMKGHSQN
jgi:hypothetical protein